MPNMKSLAIPFKIFGFKINRDIQLLLKVISHPHIMITDKEMNFYSRICNFCQFAKQSNIPFWNYFSVLIPEIKNISNNKNFSGIILYFFQELNNNLFPLQTAFTIRSTQMEIGKKVNFFIG